MHPVAEFLKCLPDMESPEVLLEEDGDICFDWHKNVNCTISASLRDDGRVAWSALLPSGPVHGSFTLPNWAANFTTALKEFEDYA